MKTLKILIPAFASVALLALPVAHGNTIKATNNGVLYDSTTWGNVAMPIAPDTNTWDTNGFGIDLDGAGTFYGGELLVTAGSILRHMAGGSQTFGFQAMTFDNGRIRQWRNLAKTYDLNGQALTFGSGGALFTSNNQGRNIVINNAVWRGSGDITFRRLAPATTESTGPSNFIIQTGNTLSGYTGAITMERDAGSGGHARLALNAVETTGSFGVVLGSNTSMTVPADHTHVLRSLILDGEALDVGTYGYHDFTPAQLDFLVFWGDASGQIQITGSRLGQGTLLELSELTLETQPGA